MATTPCTPKFNCDFSQTNFPFQFDLLKFQDPRKSYEGPEFPLQFEKQVMDGVQFVRKQLQTTNEIYSWAIFDFFTQNDINVKEVPYCIVETEQFQEHFCPFTVKFFEKNLSGVFCYKIDYISEQKRQPVSNVELSTDLKMDLKNLLKDLLEKGRSKKFGKIKYGSVIHVLLRNKEDTNCKFRNFLVLSVVKNGLLGIPLTTSDIRAHNKDNYFQILPNAYAAVNGKPNEKQPKVSNFGFFHKLVLIPTQNIEYDWHFIVERLIVNEIKSNVIKKLFGEQTTEIEDHK